MSAGANQAKRVLVTGAGGVIGRAVAAGFEQDGWTVSRLVHRPSRWAPGAQVVDLAACQDLTAQVTGRPDAVVHLAAAVPHSKDYPDSPESAALTQRMDKVVIAAAQSWDCPLVYASGCTLYCREEPNAKSEGDPIKDWGSPYFAAKAAGEAACAAHPKSTVLRISAPIGSGLHANVVMARFINAARDDKPLTLWGSGRREQDFIDVRDLATLFVSVVRQGARGIFNAASGHTTTMWELAETVIKRLGSGAIALSGQPDPNESVYARYDIRKARKELGWEPRHTLVDMVDSIAAESFAP
jgi:nucleoside-diphosphate-sugar epimerase